MHKIILIISLLIAGLIPTAVQAQRQQTIHFETLQIDLWPEYDRPEVLVIYRAVIADDVELPVNLTFRIPASAGEPNAVAVRPPGGALLNTDYERQVLGEWAYINLEATLPEVQLEYYDPHIVRDGKSRKFVFNWPGDYAIDSLSMLVQQPTGAENMATLPRLSGATQDSFGLLYLSDEIGAVKADETFSLTITYDKPTDDLTVNFLPVESSTPIAEDTPGRMSVNDALPWAMGILGAAVILVGVYWYWSTGRRQYPAPPRHAKQADPLSRSRVVEPELHGHESEELSTFCHQCGKRALQGDKFCRSCGAKLRT